MKEWQFIILVVGIGSVLALNVYLLQNHTNQPAFPLGIRTFADPATFSPNDDTFSIYGGCSDSNGQPLASSTAKVTVYNSSGGTYINAASMTSITTGRFYYVINAPNASGNYFVEINCSNGAVWSLGQSNFQVAAWTNNGKSQSQLFTANGTFTVPDNVTLLWVTLWGGGGGGNGGKNSTVNPQWQGGGGGGSGEAIYRYPLNVTSGASINVTVGSGGSGGAIGGNLGDPGQTSTFDILSTAGGGRGSPYGYGGNGSGIYGVSGGNLISISGANSTGAMFFYLVGGAGGGSGGNGSSTAGSGGNSVYAGGARGTGVGPGNGGGGGASFRGAGGTGGNGSNGAACTSGVAAAANSGAGGGGGSASATGNPLQCAGGAGGAGGALIEWIG